MATKNLQRGATIYVETLHGNILTTSPPGRYRRGPLPNEHIERRHNGPRAGDVLIVTNDPSSDMDGGTVVRIYGGCDCPIVIYRLPSS